MEDHLANILKFTCEFALVKKKGMLCDDKYIGRIKIP